MEIKLFSKWRPSAILNLRKLPFWSSDRYLHVILHLHSEICINRPIWSRDIAKKRFSIWRPSAILNLKNFDFFVTFACSEWKFVSVYQIWSKSDNSRPRYGDKAIFKMAAVRHLEFAKIAYWPINTKFGTEMKDHMPIYVTWPKLQFSQTQDGGRPPFWK